MNRSQNRNVKHGACDPKLTVLAQLCCDKIEDLLESLEITDLQLLGKKYAGPCPIHGDSDNPAALNIYYDGHSVPGYWKCRTKSCQNKFGKTIIGFTRGRLSHLRLNYHHEKRPHEIFSFKDTLSYLYDFLGISPERLTQYVGSKEYERLRFVKENNSDLLVPQNEEKKGIPREKVLRNLEIPHGYFLSRGFLSSTLRKFDVGKARISKPETADRAIVPIYSLDFYLSGYTARSIYSKCPLCKLYHNTELPCEAVDRNLSSKWRHVDFNSESVLYNYWRSHEEIKNTGRAILVEGPCDVWRLDEAGVWNSVAMFGHTLYDKQEFLLSRLGCTSIIVLTDNDPAGKEGAREIKEKYGRLYNLYFPQITKKDVGEMTIEEIKKLGLN
jgi:5S rRNA maturation endonuclease (ribonuclease M5)